jgi:3D (Asp-Asp-Asp) domain-containing protein
MFLSSNIKLDTSSSFEINEEVEEEVVPFETNYKDDPETEIGEEHIEIAGENGKLQTFYNVTYWLGEEVSRVKSHEEKLEPVAQLVAKGTKIVWRKLQTENGELKYWRRLRVWATKYDGNCYGCRGLTYSGTVVRKGVCAVDPKVIPLGTNFYVEGYGLCRSEDIGGGIKGNEVDLGFEKASEAAWGATWTNLYLLTNAPD